MEVKSTSRTIVENTHVVTMDKADQCALFAVAARNKLGAAPDAPATITRTDDGSIAVTIVVTSDAPTEVTPSTPTPQAGASAQVLSPILPIV